MKKILVFSIIFKQSTQSEIARFYIWKFSRTYLTQWKIINSFSFIGRCLVESLSVDGSFLPHMLGKEPSLSCRRSVGSKARVKQFSLKCTEQITTLACGCEKKFLLSILTNRTHRSLVLSVGLAALFLRLLQP